MKKLIVKIGNETHEQPYNNEVFSVEVSDKYVPKVGDCVRVECKNQINTLFYWFKVKETTKTMADFSFAVSSDLKISKNGFFSIDNNRIYTQITPEELKAKYAEAGYDWDYNTSEVKLIEWNPKNGDEVWWLTKMFTVSSFIYNSNDNTHKELLLRNLLFPTEEKCKEFLDHCLQFHKK